MQKAERLKDMKAYCRKQYDVLSSLDIGIHHLFLISFVNVGFLRLCCFFYTARCIK